MASSAGLDIATVLLFALLFGAVAYSIFLKKRLQQQFAERLEVDKRLHYSEAEYRALIETAPFPIVLTRISDNILVFANRRLLEQVGLKSEQLLNKPAINYYENPEDRQRLIATLKEKGHVSDFETRMRLPNGELRWAYISASVSRFNNEEVMYVSFNDITALKEIENKLENNRRHLCAIFDNAIVGISLISPEGRYLEANAHWGEMLGYKSHEIRDTSNLAITHPDDAARSRVQFDALVAGEIGFYTLDKRFVRRDGSVFWASMSAAPIHDSQGAIESVVCVIQNINERKLADERLQRILREFPIATVIVDESGHFVYRSEKFELLFGYPYDEVNTLGDWLPRAYPDPIYREQVQKIVADIITESQAEGRTSNPVELRVRCKNGTDKMIEFRYVDLVEQGIWTLNDVTERDQLATAMRAVNDHLMERLSEIQSLQEQLREQAMRDALTGLFNRRYLDEMLERELARALREGHPLTVMMLDIDHFKKLNDTFGHPAGDEVLKALGDMLRHNARTEDIPCRYGGEEFLLVLPNMSLSDARERAEQWRQKFESMQVIFGQFSMNATLSIGIATFPGHGRTRDQLVEAADQALYAAKHNGRNRIEISGG
jgi:diguanylate cyclase (GGDEF)-like protein/PAS domain S-box-containing protein